MGLTGDVIAKALEQVGGDPSDAMEAARRYSSVQPWINSQVLQAAAAGALAMSVPGAHAPALVADMAWLLRKMAVCSWGVGAIHGRPVDALVDLQVILAHWSGAITDEVIDAGISVATIAGAAYVQGGQAFIQSGIGMASGQLTAKLAGKAGMKLTGKSLALVTSGTTKLSSKLAAKIAAKVGAKYAAKGVLGFLPVVGPVAGAAINGIIVKSIGRSADFYYTHKEDWNPGPDQAFVPA
jgi:hypothetical protein